LEERLVRPLVAEIVEGNKADLFSSTDPERDAWAIFDLTRSTMYRHMLAREAPSPDSTVHLVGMSFRLLGSNENSSIIGTGDTS
jgi:hypothetical protein